MSHQRNLQRIRAVAHALHGLHQPVVFVGGATVSLYAPPLMSSEVRPTDDVDVVIELASYTDYSLLDEKLRSLGFQNDTQSNVICRYRIKGIVVDIMPLHADVLGFSNRWYPEGFQNAISVTIAPKVSVMIFSVLYFIASKLEAFKSRGGNDYRTSTDFEDIVYVLENCPSVEHELLTATGNLKAYLQQAFRHLLEDPYLEEGIYAHLAPTFAAQKSRQIIQMIREFIA